jgi:hypothetical protein
MHIQEIHSHKPVDVQRQSFFDVLNVFVKGCGYIAISFSMNIAFDFRSVILFFFWISLGRAMA